MNKKQDRATRTKNKNKANGKPQYTPKAGPKSKLVTKEVKVTSSK